MTRLRHSLTSVCLATGLAPVPAWADLPPPLAAAIKLCVTPGLTVVQRRDHLEQAGFDYLPAEARADAATALTPGNLAMVHLFGVLGWVDDPAANSARLADAALRLQDRATRNATFEDMFVAGAGDQSLWLALSATDGPGAVSLTYCTMALPPGDWLADLTPMFNRPVNLHTDEPHLKMIFFEAEEVRDTIYLVTYAPVAFGGTATLPQLIFGPVATPD